MSPSRQEKVPIGFSLPLASLKELAYASRTFEYGADLEKIEALTAEEVSSAFRKYIGPAKLLIVEADDFKKGPAEK